MGAPKLIYLLFSQCGITNQEGLCDYTNRNFTNANDDVTIAEAGPGVYTAMWQLSLALVFKLLVTIFTFGIKGIPPIQILSTLLSTYLPTQLSF